MIIVVTLRADLAVAVGVTGLQESGGLGVGQCAGSGLEILQEKPSENNNNELDTFNISMLLSLACLTSAPPPR